MNLAFDHIHYRCSDFVATRVFYCEILGGENLGFVESAGRKHLHMEIMEIMSTPK